MAAGGSRTLKLALVADVSKFRRGLDSAGSKFRSFGRGIAKVAVGFGAVAGAAAVIGQKVLTLGAQLEGWRKKTDTVFEGSAGAVRKWADGLNEVFGVTDDELAGLAAGFGDLLKPMGFTSAQAAQMSTDVIGLAGALSEWTGGTRSAAEVSDILAKAMLGEREGLKELGISISEADVQARLAADGNDKLTGTALQQAKATATQALIFEKSTDAQAAFADGGNKALRAQNRLSAGLKELRERAVEKLLPLVIAVTDWMGENMPVAVAKATEVWEALQPTLATLGEWLGEKLPPLFATVQRVIETVSRAFDTFTATLRRNLGNGDSALSRFVSRFADLFGQLVEVVRATFEVLKTGVETGIAIILEFWERFGSHIVEFLAGALDNVISALSGAFDIITGLFDLVTSILTGDWGKAWDSIKKILAGALRVITSTLQLAWRTITTALGAVIAAISLLWSGLWSGIRSVLRAGVDAVRSIWSGLWDGAKNLASSAFDSIVSTIASFPGRAASALGGLGSSISNAVSGSFSGITSAFRGAINAIISGWNRLEFRIPGFDPPGPGPKFGGFTLGVPNIPHLARGGIVRSPTLALIGEAGPEAVVPLSRPGSAGLAGGGGITINVTGAIDPQATARQIERVLRRLDHSAGKIPA